ncbi:MAG TPA: hypothetical protein [Caudoviricetes sp.]|nr:MAG TPA: hypothetical protein [Caudoviricetes sp.]
MKLIFQILFLFQMMATWNRCKKILNIILVLVKIILL